MANLNRTFGILSGLAAAAAIVGFVLVLTTPATVGIGPASQAEALIFLATMAVIMGILVVVQFWVADFLKDLPKPPRLSDRLAEAKVSMANASSMMTGLSVDASATADLLVSGQPTTAVVSDARDTGTYVNFEPLVEVHLLVDQPGLPPRPVVKRLVLSPLHLARVQPGTRLAVRIVPGNPDQLAIDWSQPAPI